MVDHAEAAREFLAELWDGKPDKLYILIWLLESRTSVWFTDLDRAADHAVASGNNVYTGVGLSPEDYGSGKRCKADRIAALPGLWADIDYQSGDAHKSETLPVNEIEAKKLIRSIGLEPTLIVHSGHGLQPWWLFKEPLVFESDLEREQAAEFSRRWQATIQEKARRAGYEVDPVPDLARVLRVPGTYNAKSDPRVLVRITEHSGSRCADWEDFERVMLGGDLQFPYSGPVTAQNGPESIETEIAGDESQGSGKTAEAKPWEHYEKILHGVSEGSRNNSLTSLIGRLLKDSDTQDSVLMQIYLHLVENLNLSRFNPPLPPEELRNTFSSLLRKEARRQHDENFERQFEETHSDSLLGTSGNTLQLQLIGKKFGGLPIVKIIKRGRVESEYSLVLNTGQEIDLGHNLDNQARIRRIVRDALNGQYRLKRMKQENWEQLADKIAQLAVFVDDPGEDRRGQIDYYVERYLTSSEVHGEDNVPYAVKNDLAFIRGGVAHVHLGTLHAFISKTLEAKVPVHFLRRGLLERGFTHKKISVRAGDRVICRSYWLKPVDDIGEQAAPDAEDGHETGEEML